MKKETANKAIELLKKDKKNVSRMSSYYHLLSKCYYRNGEEENSKKMLEKAIEVCSDTKYKQELMALQG